MRPLLFHQKTAHSNQTNRLLPATKSVSGLKVRVMVARCARCACEWIAFWQKGNANVGTVDTKKVQARSFKHMQGITQFNLDDGHFGRRIDEATLAAARSEDKTSPLLSRRS
mmetsp:Transcript_16266/g.31646  ORF Transcript_16266/g.31646 Transcript_16266/m.31646 type:complete len:112 (+) Transcript_16266:161-496(+)